MLGPFLVGDTNVLIGGFGQGEELKKKKNSSFIIIFYGNRTSLSSSLGISSDGEVVELVMHHLHRISSFLKPKNIFKNQWKRSANFEPPAVPSFPKMSLGNRRKRVFALWLYSSLTGLASSFILVYRFFDFLVLSCLFYYRFVCG